MGFLKYYKEEVEVIKSRDPAMKKNIEAILYAAKYKAASSLDKIVDTARAGSCEYVKIVIATSAKYIRFLSKIDLKSSFIILKSSK